MRCGWTAGGYEIPAFASVVPDAVQGAGTEKVRLVIVGGGLTGLTLAADVAERLNDDEARREEDKWSA